MFENLEREYDVIVVGMGPAGSSVSKHCGEKGLKVLAVEKRQEIGVPVRCGEGLSRSSAGRMGIKFDRSWVAKVISGATAYAPNGKKITVDYEGPEGWVIERKIFDKYLAKLAAEAGAKILTKTEVVGVRRGGGKVNVKMKSGGRVFKATCKILVACDGIESRIARMMGMNTTLNLGNIASCVQFEMTNVKIDPDRIEMYFGNGIAPGGYVWIFPKGKRTANVGVGVRKPFAKRHAVEYLNDFIRSRPGLSGGSILEVNSGGVPVGGLMEDMVSDNFVIVGDAAHQVNPIHGGGIAESYAAGRIAGDVIAKAIESDNFSKKFLSEYNKKWWETRGKKMKRLLKLRKVIESLKDEELNWLIAYLKGDDLINLARASGLKKLGFVLMKKPRLVTVARKLF
jgi:digeranylgeranylglycerophospholipid reductase